MADVPDGFEPLPFPEDMNCCICLEPMLRAVTLDPCKHKVCQGCEAGLAARRQCPHCRHALTGAALDHTFSNLVHDAYHRMRCSGCLQEVTDAARHQCAVAALMQKFADQLGSLSDATARALIARELANPAGTPAEQEARVGDCLAREAAYLDEQLRSLAATAGAGPAPEQRRRGEVAFVGVDKKGEVFGKVTDAETGMTYFLHSRSLLDGAILQPMLQVSYVLAPSPLKLGEDIAAQARAEDPAARRRGVVKVWWAERKFGFITEAGADRRDLWFGGADWQGEEPPQAEMPVEFTAGVSAVVADRPVALRIHPARPTAPAVGPAALPAGGAPPAGPGKGGGASHPLGSPASSSSSAAVAAAVPATPPLDAGAGKVYVLWDFDDLQGWGRARTLQAYQAILGRLLSDGVIATAAEPTTLAFGALAAFSDTSVAQALDDLGVEVKAHSGLKKEQTNRNLEREAEALAGRADTRTVVIVSSDTDFVALTRRLVNQGKRALVLHGAPVGSEPEQMLRTFVPAHFLPELAMPTESRVPSTPLTPATPSTPSPVEGPKYGKVTRVAVDKHGKVYGFVEDSESKATYYFHSNNVVGGVEAQPGLPVVFRLASDPKSPTGVVAVQVDVWSGDAPLRRGVVKAWKPAKQLGFVEEPGEKDVFFHANEWKGSAPPEVGQAVEFVATLNPKFPDQRYGQRVTPVGPAMATTSQAPLPLPPRAVAAVPSPGPSLSQSTTTAAPPTAAELRRGKVTKVAVDKNGRQFGYIEDIDSKVSHYFHSNNVAEGVQAEPGLLVCFRLMADPKSPMGVVAAHVTLWAGDQAAHPGPTRRGVVKAWKPAKQLGFVEEPGEKDVFFHANEWKGSARPEVGQAVEFVATLNPKFPDQRYGQRVTPVGPAMATTSQAPPTQPGPAPASPVAPPAFQPRPTLAAPPSAVPIAPLPSPTASPLRASGFTPPPAAPASPAPTPTSAPISPEVAALQTQVEQYVARYAGRVPLAPPTLRAIVLHAVALGLDPDEQAFRIETEIALERSKLHL